MELFSNNGIVLANFSKLELIDDMSLSTYIFNNIIKYFQWEESNGEKVPLVHFQSSSLHPDLPVHLK